MLRTRTDLVVVARTDATDEDEMLRRAAAFAGTDAEVVLVEGMPSVDVIRRVRRAVGGKALLFNQIAGGRSPKLSLGELSDLGVDVAIYSTPCLFAAQGAIAHAMQELKRSGGKLSDAPGSVRLDECTAVLHANLQSRAEER